MTTSRLTSTAFGGLCRNLRLLLKVSEYELRKASVFRTGFLVKELLRGTTRAAVAIFVFRAIFQLRERSTIGPYDFAAIVQYLILAALAQKLCFDRRGIDLADQIFQGRITKYLVMPFSLFVLPLGRFVQFQATQLVAASVLYGALALFLPQWCPVPASLSAALLALTLVLLGSFCYFLMYLVVQTLAFFLDVVWSLLVMAAFITHFMAGVSIPISIMPPALQETFRMTFPYWSVFGAIEVGCGRFSMAEALHGVLVLLCWALATFFLYRFLWRRGVARYTGSGM